MAYDFLLSLQALALRQLQSPKSDPLLSTSYSAAPSCLPMPPDSLQDEITRQLLAELSPEEAPFASEIIQSLHEEEKSGARPHSPLAFSPADFSLLLTPTLWRMVGSVLTYVARTIFDGSAEISKELLRKRLLESNAQKPAAALEGSLVLEIRKAACAEGKRLGLDTAKARLLADSILGALLATQAKRDAETR